MAKRRIAHIRLVDTHDGQNLIGSEKRHEITSEVLNGDVPGFRVNFGAGLERFYPSSNVMHAELLHTRTDECLEATAAMKALAESLQKTKGNIRNVTAKDLRGIIAKANKEATTGAELVKELPKDGQISKDRKGLVDATNAVVKLAKALEAMIPAAEEKPKS